jgi:RNA polymerase sigma factor (sigma-70 family)
MRLKAEMGHKGVQLYIEDAFQESYSHFCSLTKKFKSKEHKRKELHDYLMYIEDIIFKRLYEWYLIDMLSYKYIRPEDRSKGGTKYVPQLFRYKPKYSAEYGLRIQVEDLLSIAENRNPVQARCLKLHYLQGYEISEIAKILKIKINTVKSHIRRAKETIRRTIGEDKELFLS